MGLITYTNLEDNTPATANGLNERFGAILAEVNGNLDTQNIKNSAITREKIASGAVTSDKLSVDKYIDANGWTVNDFGTYKTWKRRITGTPGTNIPSNDLIVLPSVPLPIGVTKRSDVTLQATMNANDRVFLFTDDTDPDASSFYFRISNWYPVGVTLSRYSVDLNLERLT